MMKPWCDKYIGIPFVSKGRTDRGLDCWGLVHLIYKNECNIILPTYDHIDSTDGRAARDAMIAAARSDDWIEIEKQDLKDFDVIRMRSHYNHMGVWKAAVAHVGIVFRKKFIIHVEEGINVVCVPFTHPEVDERIISFHRHKGIA